MYEITLVIDNPSIPKEKIEEEIQKCCEEHNISKDKIRVIFKEEYEKEKRIMTEGIPEFDFELFKDYEYTPPANITEITQKRTIKEKQTQQKYALKYSQRCMKGKFK